jgi:hypothetical protein
MLALFKESAVKVINDEPVLLIRSICLHALETFTTTLTGCYFTSLDTSILTQITTESALESMC